MIIFFPCAVSCSVAGQFVNQGVFYDTFIQILLNNFFFRNFSIGRGNSTSPKAFTVSSIIVLCQKYVGVQINLENAFAMNVPSQKVGSPLGSLSAVDAVLELIDKGEAELQIAVIFK